MKTLSQYAFILIISSLISKAEVSGPVLNEHARNLIVGQIGDPYLWGKAFNGGYILKFSEDIDGDGSREDFIGSTMSGAGIDCVWSVFSNGKDLGDIIAMPGYLLALKDEQGLNFPISDKISPMEILVRNQALVNDEFRTERKITNTEDFAEIENKWNSKGKKFTPKVQAILLTDYASGDRRWREFRREDYKIAESGNPYLIEDEERLRAEVITPEQALELLKENDTKTRASSYRSNSNENPRLNRARIGNKESTSHGIVVGSENLFYFLSCLSILLLVVYHYLRSRKIER